MSNKQTEATKSTCEAKTNKSELVREYKASNPQATTKEISRATGTTQRYAAEVIRRENRRAAQGKGLTYGRNTNTPENEVICPYRIDADVRSFLINTYGQSHGIFACLLLSQESTDLPSLSRFLLSGCHVKSLSRLLRGLAPRDYYSASYLASFQREMPFYADIGPASEGKHARRCLEFSFSEDVTLEIESILKRSSGRLVNVFTGKESQTFPPVTLSKDKAIKDIQLRMNDQDLDYSSLIKDRSSAIGRVLDEIRNDSARYLQRSMFEKIRHSPKPLYSAKERTVRLYALGSSLMSLCRSARKALFNGFVQFDLKHAQVSIIAKLWEAEDIKERLSSGNLWKDMQRNTGLSKDLLKKILYTIIFGGSLSQAIHDASKELGEEFSYHKTSAKVLKDPLFNRLYSASIIQTKKLKESQSCIDAFNHERLIPTGKVTDKKGKSVEPEKGKFRSEDFRSAKACQAQSYEMAIMLPMVKYLLDKEVSIWLFLHDGIILPEGSEVHFDECRRIVREAASAFGIDIDLTMEVIHGDSQVQASPVAKMGDAA